MSILNPALINSCRVCRSPNQDGDYQCLFETASEHEEGNTELTESGALYEKLLGIPLNERNYYPKFLCNSCHLQMKLFLKLKDKALKTLEYLQSVYDEVHAHSAEYMEKNYNYQSNEQIISSDEPPDCQVYLDEYQLREYEIFQENVANKYAENTDDEFDKTTADEHVPGNTNCAGENKMAIPAQSSPYNDEEDHIEQKHNTMTTNIDTNFEDDIKIQSDCLENKFLTEIESAEYPFQTPHPKEYFPTMKERHILDKNDYVTEIYELIDDADETEQIYLENQKFLEEVDSNSVSEIKTETSSTYNDVEYLLEEDIDDLESEADIRNSAKRRRLRRGSDTSRKCLSCGLEFENFQLYKLHRIEAQHGNFTCNACSKAFRTMTALDKHIKTQHDKEPAFRCEICHKTFNQKVHFQYHMNYHNNIRNYKCDICEKAFIGKADLKSHLRSHTGERPYVCNVCGKDYLMMEHLKAHFITHTEQSFPCEVCHKQFATHKTLRLHVRTIHEDEPRFKCTFCLKPFRRKHHLEYHLKSHEKSFKNLETSGEIVNELDSLDDIVEEAIDDPGYIFLA